MSKKEKIFEEEKDGRLSKQFGDFAEGLVMYVLGKYKKMRVALVDHIGADIIANRKNSKEIIAISVKGRNFPDKESKSYTFDKHNIEMLNDFSRSFGMVPCIAFVFVDKMEDEWKIRIFILKIITLEKLLKDEKVQYVTSSKENGYIFKYTKSTKVDYLSEIKKRKDIEYIEFKMMDIDYRLNI